MVNEERVKRLYKIALYEQKEEKNYRQMGQYYKSDYVGKEIIKSIFTGTLAFAGIVLLWLLSSWQEVLEEINNLQIVYTVLEIVLYYVLFLALYLVLTHVIYALRYDAGKKKLKEYTNYLKNAHQMYEREEKLKQ